MNSLNSKVLTLVEQEANTNMALFFLRFQKTLRYYSAIFKSLYITLARESKERMNVEQQCLARDIMNVIACEGAEQVERHEMTRKWRARMTMASFLPYPLSQTMNNTLKMLLKPYSKKYRRNEEDGVLFLEYPIQMQYISIPKFSSIGVLHVSNCAGAVHGVSNPPRSTVLPSMSGLY